MPAEENDPLRGKLEQVENRLQAALGEVCDDNSQTGVRRPDTGELIKIDETLALAQEAAKQAISLRRRMRSGPRKGGRADDAARPAERAE
jgi:hypothetical protein